MTENAITQEERTLAAASHASILLGIFTSGIGGMIAALIIWVMQKDKSEYVAFQALQSLVYQVASTVIMMISWCCWFALYMFLIFVPLASNPMAYETQPPAGLWVGLFLMVVPFAIWGLFILYGLWGAVRTLGGDDFRYVIVGNWLKNQA
jgi:uncharacterized Tic20 family protein